MSYNPALHHRKSIRLKGHDYSGRGVYFVTLCAHREAGSIFANEAAKRVAEKCWQDVPGHFPQAEAGEFVVMPDHVHGIIRMVGAKHLSPVQPEENPPAHQRPHGTSRTLGSVIRGFKIGVVKGIAATGRIWHRNYYEMIVRTEEAEDCGIYPHESLAVCAGNGWWIARHWQPYVMESGKARGFVQPECAQNRQPAKGGRLSWRMAFSERKGNSRMVA